MRRVAHAARRLPGRMLGAKEPPETLVRYLDAEVTENLPDERRILDLLECPRLEDPRQIDLPKACRHGHVVGQSFIPERSQAGLPTGLEELLVIREMEERVAPVEEDGVQHESKGRVSRPVIRRILYALLALGPITILLSRLDAGENLLFVLAALALIPLAWVIGEATEQAAHHTGPGIGGFLNATFGNAPELIIALFAVNEGLTEVVRGSLTGSVIGNLLLVLGFSLAFGGRGRLDRESSLTSFALVAVATLVLLIPSIPGLDGDPDRRSLAEVSLWVSIALLVVYVVVTWVSLRRHRQLHAASEGSAAEDIWSLRRALVVLGIATLVTAFVAEALVHSLEAFAEDFGLTDFFVAAVIVAIVGNAAEHGGAVVVAARGNLKLAAEIALASSAQVAVFLIPAVAVLSWAIEPLSLAFRPIEVFVVGGSVVFASLLLFRGYSTRSRGIVLILAYVGVAVAFFFAGER
jgi:Ca2+:H+ antiporter